jgi:hypothetical protein
VNRDWKDKGRKPLALGDDDDDDDGDDESGARMTGVLLLMVHDYQSRSQHQSLRTSHNIQDTKDTHHNKHPPKDISDNEDSEDGQCGQTEIKDFADLVPDSKCETRSAAVSLCCDYLIEVRLHARVRVGEAWDGECPAREGRSDG